MEWKISCQALELSLSQKKFNLAATGSSREDNNNTDASKNPKAGLK